MTRRQEFLAALDEQVRDKTELGEEMQRFTREEREFVVDLGIARELINPAYGSDQAQAWLGHCFDVLDTLQEKSNGEDMTAQDRAELGPSIKQALDNPPAGLRWKQFIRDLNAAEDKVKRTA